MCKVVGRLCGSIHIFGCQGFQTLVEKEWLCFGHKFADRTGQVDDNDHEQSPVFLQWLDCVHQLAVQFPTAFEFSCIYLVCLAEGFTHSAVELQASLSPSCQVKLAHHCYSRLFGTFLGNCEREREEKKVSHRTLSVWPILEIYVNDLYSRNEAVRALSC